MSRIQGSQARTNLTFDFPHFVHGQDLVFNSEFQAQKFDDATRTFGLVTSGSTATASEKAHAHLWMGRMSDSRRNRADALKHYNAVLGLDVDSEIKSDAQRLIRKPFGSP